MEHIAAQLPDTPAEAVKTIQSRAFSEQIDTAAAILASSSPPLSFARAAFKEQAVAVEALYVCRAFTTH
jgi:hypothetical protein